MTLTALPTTDAPTTLDAPVHAPDDGGAPVDGHRTSDDRDAPADAADAQPADAQPAGVSPADGQSEPPASEGAAGAAAQPRSDARPRAPRPAAAPRGFPRAERPGTVPIPDHHHLPGWVRRDYARVRPALADLLGLLQGDERAAFSQRLDELTTGISAGRFSLAFQYPALVEDGRRIYEGQREHIAEVQKAQRELERTRRLAGDRLREAAGLVAPDVSARLQRSLRGAGTAEAISEVAGEVDRVVSASQGTAGRRKQREIDKTRSRILRALPASALAAEEPQESWQDVLRRFAEEQGGGEAE